MKDSLNKLIGHALVQTSILIKVYTIRFYKKLKIDITPEQFVVLSILDDEEVFHQRELGEILFKDRANIARLIKILEKKELIERTKTADKRLVNKIKLTQKGLDLKNEIYPMTVNLRQKYLSQIDPEDLKTCLKVLTQIKDNLIDEVKLKI